MKSAKAYTTNYTMVPARQQGLATRQGERPCCLIRQGRRRLHNLQDKTTTTPYLPYLLDSLARSDSCTAEVCIYNVCIYNVMISIVMNEAHLYYRRVQVHARRWGPNQMPGGVHAPHNEDNVRYVF